MQRSSNVNGPISQPGTKGTCVHSCATRAWGCIGLQYRSTKTRTQYGVTQIRAVTSASQSTERSAQDNQLLWYRRYADQLCGGAHRRAPEVRQYEHISTSDSSQSTIVSYRGTTLALGLVSMAAVACWCTPVYAETSVQAAEQVAQQLTSANSGSLSKNALATGSKSYCCNTLIA